jgi:hypothetical protein
MVGKGIYSEMGTMCFMESRGYVMDHAGSGVWIKGYGFEGKGVEDWWRENVPARLFCLLEVLIFKD